LVAPDIERWCLYRSVEGQTNRSQFTIHIKCAVLFLTLLRSRRTQEWQEAGNRLCLEIGSQQALAFVQRQPAEPKRIIRLGLKWLTGLGVRAP
jgi:hypothetical protein